MSAQIVDMSSVCPASQCYPEGHIADAIEQRISLTLPVIEGLTPGMTQEQRLDVLSNTVSSERAGFIALHGDPFGADQLDATTGDPAAGPFMTATPRVLVGAT